MKRVLIICRTRRNFDEVQDVIDTLKGLYLPGEPGVIQLIFSYQPEDAGIDLETVKLFIPISHITPHLKEWTSENGFLIYDKKGK